MKRLVFLVAVMSFALLFSCSKRGEQKSEYIAKVGTEVITREDVSRELRGLPIQIQKMFEGADGVEKFVNELVKKEMLYQEAKKRGFEKSSEYQKKIDNFKKITLVGLLLEKEIEEKSKVTDKDVKDYYDAHKAELTANNQVRASHILVQREEEAKKIMEQLKRGGDFAKIAREKSIDSGSAKNGGDLGFFSRGQMVPEFEKVAFGLKEGQMAGPVKTQFGYHIIKVTGRKEGQAVEFEKVKSALTQKLIAEKQKEVFDSYVNNLKGGYKIDINKGAISKIWGASKEGDKPSQTGSQPEGQK